MIETLRSSPEREVKVVMCGEMRRGTPVVRYHICNGWGFTKCGILGSRKRRQEGTRVPSILLESLNWASKGPSQAVPTVQLEWY